MSQEKCGRAKNTTVCQWVPGSDELAEWATRKAWNERKEGDELPQYVGTNLHQKPRGCYPITKTKIDMKAIANVRKQKEGVAFGLKLPPKDDLTEAEQAEAEIQRKPLTEAQKEKMQKKKLQYAEMLKKLRATKSKTDDPTYETKQGGIKRRTKKRKRRKRKKTKRRRRKRKKTKRRRTKRKRRRK
jgi:colicin import membrane protein